MKFKYRSSLEIPRIQKKDNDTTEACGYHCHDVLPKGVSPYKKLPKIYQRKKRDKLRMNVDLEKMHTNTCLTFWRTYKEEANDISAEDKAAVASAIEQDEKYLKALNNLRPGACTIL